MMETNTARAGAINVPLRYQILEVVSRHAHIALATGVVGVVALMILPIPAPLLDVLIAFNLASSVLLLMLALYIPGALGLSTFPSLILMTTVLRLALNIASTKQILLHAHAGHVIETFGRLVMGGSVAVGLVAFAIIAIVQFIVISKGAERVAEVGARFTLDALPGKQMSIEADLRAGIIDKHEARRQRLELQQESHMHGSMDGAMKFVKGDAIAAIIIALVNVIAGIAIGVGALGMPFADAVARYTLLSVGDGMVSQIPSLLTSVAAGIVITRTVSQKGQPQNLAAQIGRQVFAQPVAIFVCGAVLLVMALIPGFPSITFILLGLVVVGLGWLARSQLRDDGAPRFDTLAALPGAVGGGAESHAALAAQPDLIAVPLLLRIAEGRRTALSPIRLQQCMERERSHLQQELGLPFPLFQVRFDPSLPEDDYAIDVQELPAQRGSLATLAEGAEPEAELAQAVATVIRMRTDAFVGTQEVQSLLKRMQEQLPELSEEVARAMPAQRIADVLRRLALEGVSLRYLREVYESLLVWVAREKDVAMLTEYVRIDLGRFICHRLLDAERRLHALTLDPALETQLRDAVQQSPSGAFLALPPETLMQLLSAAQRSIGGLDPQRAAVLLATLETRRFLRRILAPRFPQLHVLSLQELPPDVHVHSVGRLALLSSPAPQQRVAAQG